MAILSLVRRKLMRDEKLGGMVVRGTNKEILIDLDGDRQADIALMDTTGEGKVDTIAADLTGDNLFNLYFMDVNMNGTPDISYEDVDGEGNIHTVSISTERQQVMIPPATRIFSILLEDDFDAEAFENALFDLKEKIDQAKAEACSPERVQINKTETDW